MSSTKVWTHNALADDLANYLRTTGDKMVWTDIQLGTAHSCRPDVLTLDRSYTIRAMAYEVKVALSDYRRDVTEGKWTKYADTAQGVYFAVPQGLVTVKDLPPGAGLYVRGPETWRAVRKPTPAKQPKIGQDVWMKLLMDGIDREVKRDRVTSRGSEGTAHYRAVAVAQKRVGDTLARALRDAPGFESRVAEERIRVQASIDDLHERLDRERANYAEERKRTAAAAEGVLVDLAIRFGLPPHSGIYEIQRAAKATYQRTQAHVEVAHLRAQLDAVRLALRFADPPALASAPDDTDPPAR